MCRVKKIRIWEVIGGKSVTYKDVQEVIDYLNINEFRELILAIKHFDDFDLDLCFNLSIERCEKELIDFIAYEHPAALSFIDFKNFEYNINNIIRLLSVVETIEKLNYSSEAIKINLVRFVNNYLKACMNIFLADNSLESIKKDESSSLYCFELNEIVFNKIYNLARAKKISSLDRFQEYSEKIQIKSIAIKSTLFGEEVNEPFSKDDLDYI